MSVHLIQSWPIVTYILFLSEFETDFIHLLALISFPREKLTDLSLDVCVEVEDLSVSHILAGVS